MPRTWSAVLARTGVPTGDGRILDPVGGTSRDLPLPLSWQERSEDGHGGSVIVGRIETMQFRGGMVLATGSMLDTAPYAVIEQLEAGVIGPSVDLDDIEYVMDDAERLVITKWRVSGATLVSIPAFAEVSLTLDPEPAQNLEAATAEEDYSSLFASAAGNRTEQLPPRAWFERPDLDRLTPVTVSDSGRVFGHIAGWGTCHVGLPGCVTPPASMTSYAYFHQSSQRTAEGEELAVGTMVAGPRHADPQLAFHAATQHYDDPSAAVAKVVAGEDEHGIWVAGWLLPGASEQARETFMSNPVSGDWRRVAGSLELIAVCSVNSAGFPIPRARVAFSSGAQRALVGTFGLTPQTDKEPLPEPQNHKNPRAAWAWAVAMEG